MNGREHPLKISSFKLILLGALMILSSVVTAEDCKSGKIYATKGMEAGQQKLWVEAKQWLYKSVTQCNRFNNWYLLGQVYAELNEFDDSASAFEDARRYAKDDDERAIAIARYAQIQSKQGLVAQPLSLLHAAQKMHSNTPKWITALTRDLDEKRVSQPLTVAQVTGALNNRSIKLLNINTKPSLNVSIRFKFDSAELVGNSEQQLSILATALMDKSLNRKKIKIIGHTDRRGSGQYNSSLSNRRAKFIADSLGKLSPKLAVRLSTSGAGEKEPLYNGNSEWEHQMNRRIEVQLNE